MAAGEKIRVWDIPTRLFHWLLVGLFCFSWWSAENRSMDWHRNSGTAVLALVLFRWMWGVIGSNTARFASFVRSPMAVLTHWRLGRAAPRRPGHNPLGGYSVVALLLLLTMQITTGLLAVDVDGIESGPLSFLLPFDDGRIAARIHHLSFNLLLAVISVHVVAILFYLVVRKRNLIRPMFTGLDSDFDREATALVPASKARFALAAVIVAGLAWWISNGLKF